MAAGEKHSPRDPDLRLKPSARACLALTLLTACTTTQTRTPDWVEIPAGYRGYLVVQYSDPACPPLERRGEHQVVRIGDDGRACTSEPYELQEGVARDRMFYVYADGQLIELDLEDASLGTMYGGDLHRISGWVFAKPRGNAYADHAIWSCAWSDTACWRVLREARR